MGVDAAYRRARTGTVALVVVMLVSGVAMPVVGLVVEERPLWRVLGGAGIAAFTAALAWALHDEFRPGDGDGGGVRASSVALVAATVASVPLVGPVGAPSGEWESWAWLAGVVVGVVPLLLRGLAAVLAVVVTVATAVGVALAVGGSVLAYVVITLSVGVTLALANGLQLGMWRLVVQARDGQEARARLAATEERLRFARDVHDLLGHDLSVIALKAELAKRLAPVDADRAGEQAAEIQRLAGAALEQVRRAVHGYRAIDLRDQLDAVRHVLDSAGVRCTVRLPEGELPPVATHLVPVLREAVTNLLRHSRAVHCTIDVEASAEQVRMVVTNDGVSTRTDERDPHSHGLRGLADRLAEVGGTVVADGSAGTFTVTATVPVAA
ncbi:histidine kinase [Jiangella asiatica]|uniref:Histidine kinase n=1 Tax=Jiangella asiatica TaxID=2530372 RepID=A0A4R5D5A3_9ACTN|nr:histidine kinase [Jiangella asiatica]